MKDQLRKKERKKIFWKLIKKIRKDPEVGLGLFYDTYGKLIFAAAQTICHSRDQSEEVVNDVLLKVWLNAAKFKKIEYPGTWLFTMAVNTAKDRKKEEDIFSLDGETAAVRDEIADFEQEQFFYDAIRFLSETEQQILIQKFVYRKTFQEIADDTGQGLSTVSSSYYRALAKIKKNLKNFEEDA